MYNRLRLHAAEGQVGDCFGHVDLTDQIAVGSIATNPVFFSIGPALGAPDIAVGGCWARFVAADAGRRVSNVGGEQRRTRQAAF
jgi:hypothetical protein